MAGIFSFLSGLVSDGGNRIDVPELAGMLDRREDIILIDCRSVGEFKTGHIAGSVNVPLDRLSSSDALKSTSRIVVYCASGVRSQKALKVIKAAGVKDAVDLEGGINAWISGGKSISR